jgi:protein TonB
MNTRLISALFLAAVFCPTAFTSLSAADQPPKAIAQPSPAYPFDLRESQAEGEVQLDFTITAQGRVTDLTVVRSSNWVFRDLALAAVRLWRFTPALKDGHPISVKVSQNIVFAMAEDDPERAAALAIARHKARPVATDLASNR